GRGSSRGVGRDPAGEAADEPAIERAQQPPGARYERFERRAPDDEGARANGCEPDVGAVVAHRLPAQHRVRVVGRWLVRDDLLASELRPAPDLADRAEPSGRRVAFAFPAAVRDPRTGPTRPARG